MLVGAHPWQVGVSGCGNVSVSALAKMLVQVATTVHVPLSRHISSACMNLYMIHKLPSCTFIVISHVLAPNSDFNINIQSESMLKIKVSGSLILCNLAGFGSRSKVHNRSQSHQSTIDCSKTA